MFKHGVKHNAGIYDDAMRLAVRRFQQKHMIYESNYCARRPWTLWPERRWPTIMRR